MGGKLNYQETDYMAKYDQLPWGFVSRMHQKGVGPYLNGKEGFKKYAEKSRNVWLDVAAAFTTLPDTDKYGLESWEWTIQREYLDHMVERASYILECALELEGENLEVRVGWRANEPCGEN